jgi:hypothetical protein
MFLSPIIDALSIYATISGYVALDVQQNAINNGTLPAHNSGNNDPPNRRSTILYEIVDRLVERAGVSSRPSIDRKLVGRDGQRLNERARLTLTR